MKRIAVIGGGPKAAAICAKAHCINLSRRQLHVRVFEKAEWGGAWTGQHGYTDGEQRLCTPAERDVGFPYGQGLLNAAGVRTLFQQFSWSTFLVEADGDPEGYRNWVDRGRKPPPHGVYAAYLAWVIEKAGVQRTKAEVTAISRVNDKWTVTYGRGSQEWSDDNFDAVVFTGTGPALRGFEREDDPRIIDGVRFWENPEGFLARAGDSEEPTHPDRDARHPCGYSLDGPSGWNAYDIRKTGWTTKFVKSPPEDYPGSSMAAKASAAPVLEGFHAGSTWPVFVDEGMFFFGLMHADGIVSDTVVVAFPAKGGASTAIVLATLPMGFERIIALPGLHSNRNLYISLEGRYGGSTLNRVTLEMDTETQSRLAKVLLPDKVK